jgi:hypothetical protein
LQQSYLTDRVLIEALHRHRDKTERQGQKKNRYACEFDITLLLPFTSVQHVDEDFRETGETWQIHNLGAAATILHPSPPPGVGSLAA